MISLMGPIDWMLLGKESAQDDVSTEFLKTEKERKQRLKTKQKTKQKITGL